MILSKGSTELSSSWRDQERKILRRRGIRKIRAYKGCWDNAVMLYDFEKSQAFKLCDFAVMIDRKRGRVKLGSGWLVGSVGEEGVLIADK